MHRLKISRSYAYISVTALGLVAVSPAFAPAQQLNPGATQSPHPDSSQDTSPAPASSADSAKHNAIGLPATVLVADNIQGVLGKEVKSHTGENMGRIVDVIVDRSATVQGAVIDFGGFLGVGSRQIAVAWKALRFSQQDKSNVLIVDFTKDQLRAAPAYKAGEQVVLLRPAANVPTQTDAPLPAAPADAPAQAATPHTPMK
jgi:hypothetical protein